MLKICILTPEKEVLTSEVINVVIPTSSGEIGVLTGHAELFSTITSGVLKIKTKEKKKIFAVHHGLIHICSDKISILVKICESKIQINKDRLQLAEQKIMENLQQNSKAKWNNKQLRNITRKKLLEIA